MPHRRWDPFQDLIALNQDLLGRVSEPMPSDPAGSAWVPPVDVYETEEAFFIKAEIPGVAPDDIKVRYDEGRLTISGERPAHFKHKSRKYHQVERLYGHFERTFSLAECIDCQNIGAEYDDGVLEIRLPKVTKVDGRNIKVRCDE